MTPRPLDRVREAAALMRERATAAASGPWGWETWEGGQATVSSAAHTLATMCGSHVPPPETREGVVFEGDLTPADEDTWEIERAVAAKCDAAHVAAAHPGVMLAVATWLEREADQNAGDEDHSRCDAAKKYGCTFVAALAVADAYLRNRPL